MKKRYWIAGATGLAGTALAVKLLLRPRDVVWEEHAHQLRHAERSRFMEVEGVRVHYLEAGESDAPPLFLIHGFTASTLVWSEVLLPLANAGFRVIAPDLVGFGFSQKPESFEYTIDAHARIIVGLMDRLGIERAPLVGSSYGGAIAATCALDYPSRVERLVLVSAVSNDEIKKRKLLRFASSPVVGNVISPLLLDLRWLVKRRLIKNSKGRPEIFNAERVDEHHRPLRTANTQRAALLMLRRWDGERITTDAHRIKQPTLIIWGEQDEEIPLNDGERLYQLIPNSRLVVFRHCGHLPHEEYPREFTGLVTEFCRGVKTDGVESAQRQYIETAEVSNAANPG